LRCDCKVRVAKGCVGCCCWKQAGETGMQLWALIAEQKGRDGGLDLPHKGQGWKRCTVHKGWGLQGLLVVPGAANLICCSCCGFGACGWKFLSANLVCCSRLQLWRCGSWMDWHQKTVETAVFGRGASILVALIDTATDGCQSSAGSTPDA